ncbi:chaperonin 10-like protein [Mycena belliarum]|uniref:Chaperonin 10-like protein n=1 Tax=Mycena belliarum TaxID=1033014 RepID=A0AAD6UAW6_9AGAR|nr:chaperonin 10-like protein [Mycena belliae]
MSQLALLYESHGQQSVESNPIPEPREGYVQVRIEAAAFNPVDYKIFDRDSGLLIQTYPIVLGADAAGVVTRLGPGVTKFKVGDRVAFLCAPAPDGVGAGEIGGFQQYAVADVKITFKIPANADFDAASSFPGAGMTAGRALYAQLGLKTPWAGGEGAYKGEKMVVLGGSSSVGSYTVQLAVLSGFEVISTASPAHFAYVKSLGASTVIDRSAPDAAAQILAAAGGPVKYVVDSISLAPTQILAVDVLQSQGKLVLELGADPSAKAAADARSIAILLQMGAGAYYKKCSIIHCREDFWDSIQGWVERGVLKFNRTRILPGGLRAWEEGFDLHRQGKVSGVKLVMHPQETE